MTSLLVPKGSTILVTGANGFVGSHVVEAFLQHGYKVRGTVRALDRLSNLQQRWDERFPGSFEGVEIADLTEQGAYTGALDGVSAIVHTAADVTFANDFDRVINGAIQSTVSALKAAAAQPSIKRVVITSSYICAAMPQTGRDGSKFDETSWNDAIGEITNSLPEDHEMRGRFIYMSSKVESEKAAWKFVQEHKVRSVANSRLTARTDQVPLPCQPSFVLNTVLPGFCFGETFDDEKQRSSTSAITRGVFLMESNEIAKSTPVQAFCSATDVALLHVGAAVLGSIENRRLFGVSDILTWNDILAILRRLYPERAMYDDFDERRKELTEYDTTASLDILRALGQTGWKSIEEAIGENVAKYA
ncbi:hypothetical protein JCM11491_002431 [Sporobolomyces phaffii]